MQTQISGITHFICLTGPLEDRKFPEEGLCSAEGRWRSPPGVPFTDTAGPEVSRQTVALAVREPVCWTGLAKAGTSTSNMCPHVSLSDAHLPGDWKWHVGVSMPAQCLCTPASAHGPPLVGVYSPGLLGPRAQATL